MFGKSHRNGAKWLKKLTKYKIYGNSSPFGSSFIPLALNSGYIAKCRVIKKKEIQKISESVMYKKPLIGESPDYSNASLWYTCPKEKLMPVDIFYLYPSTCMDPTAPVIYPIDHAGMIQQAKDYYKQQASVLSQ